MAEVQNPSLPPPIIAEQVVSDQLRYRPKVYSHPKYRYTRLFPQSGFNSLTASSGTELIFQLPVKVMNLAESHLRFTVTPVVPIGAGNVIVAHKTPLSAIRQIQVISSSGAYLLDLYNVNRYLNTIFHAETPLQEFLDFPVTKTKYTASNVSQLPAGLVSADWGVGTHKSNYSPYNTIINAVEASNQVVPGPENGVGVLTDTFVLPKNGTGRFLTQAQNGGLITPSEPVVPITGRCFFETAPLPNSAFPVLNVDFKFKYLYNTIMALNKDIYLGEVVNVRIVFANVDEIYYTTAPANNTPVSNTLTYNDVLTLNPGLYSTVSPNVNISNIGLYLAIESDPNIIQSVVSEFNTSGIDLPIDYVYTYKTSFAAANPSVTARYSRSHGRHLKKIFYAAYHANEVGLSAYLRYNDLGVYESAGSIQPITRLYTMLNNERLNEFDIDCTTQQDWMLLERFLKGSAVQGVRDFQTTWFWLENFISEEPLWKTHDSTFVSGVNLDSEVKYDVYLNTPGAQILNHYLFAIVSKMLHLRPGGAISVD